MNTSFLCFSLDFCIKLWFFENSRNHKKYFLSSYFILQLCYKMLHCELCLNPTQFWIFWIVRKFWIVPILYAIGYPPYFLWKISHYSKDRPPCLILKKIRLIKLSRLKSGLELQFSLLFTLFPNILILTPIILCKTRTKQCSCI